jgi:hypothetical protein
MDPQSSDEEVSRKNAKYDNMNDL